MKSPDFHIDKQPPGVDLVPNVHAEIDRAVEETRLRAHRLVDRLGLPRDAAAFRELELEAFRAVLYLVSAIIAAVLRAAQTEIALRLEAASAARRVRSMPLRSRGVRAVTVCVYGGGLVGLWAPYYEVDRRGRPGRRRSRRGPTGSGVYPLLELLGFIGHYSPAVAAEVARQVAEAASLAVAQTTLSTLGLDLDTKTIRWIACAVADIDLRLREEATIPVASADTASSEEFAGKRIVIGVDGGRVRTREGGQRGRRRKTRRRRFDTPWREPKVFTIYSIDSKGRMERKSVPVCDGTMGDADTVFAYLIAELRRRGAAKATEIALVADGAHWIWERRERLAAALGIPATRITEIVDFYHVVQHLAEFAEARLSVPPLERQQWLRRMRSWLRSERIDAIIAEVRRLAPRGSRALVGYLEHNRPRMRYREARRRGLPIGSGAVESAIRRIVNLRIKAPGTFWTPRNAERVLHLRAYLKAGRWEELVRRVIHNARREAA